MIFQRKQKPYVTKDARKKLAKLPRKKQQLNKRQKKRNVGVCSRMLKNKQRQSPEWFGTHN
jgi:hypothetical protein